jgi:hypothetical protein
MKSARLSWKPQLERLECRSVPGSIVGLSRLAANLGVLSQVALLPAVQPDDIAEVAAVPTPTSSVTPALQGPVAGGGLGNTVGQHPTTPSGNVLSEQQFQNLVVAQTPASLAPPAVSAGALPMDRTSHARGDGGSILAATVTIDSPDGTVPGGSAFQSHGYVTPRYCNMSAWVQVDENTFIQGTSIVPPAKGYDWSFQFNNVPLNVSLYLTAEGQDPQTGEIGSDTHIIQCVT